jgi:ABC-type sugar transport system permease subunit
LLGILPALILIGVVAGGAIVQAIVISLSDWRGIGPVRIIGFENYIATLTEPGTSESLGITAIYATASTAGIIVVATILAAAVSARVWGFNAYRVIWFLPGIAPAAAVAIFWATAFQPRFGAINAVDRLFGGDGLSALLADPRTAIIPVVTVTVWAGVGFAFLLILGSIEQIPTTVYEASRVDGAGPLRQFFSITLPLARPVLIITAMLNFIWAFNGFTIVWAMTRGGPGSSTTTLPVLVYETAFSFADYGPASAIAVLGSAVLIAVGLVGIRLSRSGQ